MNPAIVRVFAVAFAIILIHIGELDALANCPVSCRCDEQNLMVNCGEGPLDVLPIALNPSIKRLIIQNNKIKTIDSSMQFYSELQFLDLSNNQLLSIPARSFQYQKNLKELNLNKNKIGSIGNGTFVGLSSLTALNLGDNFLSDLGASIFAMLPKLEELNLSKNRIDRIDPLAFMGLNNLRVLHLNDNSLSKVPSDSFQSINSLAELYLGINAFVTIENGAFEQLNGLSLLDLKGAGLENISSETFRGLETTLRTLDISDNSLKTVPTQALNQLERLEQLTLGQNPIETIGNDAFIDLTNLRQLDISGSIKLRSIETNAFASNTNLETITIVSNKALTDIEMGAFSGLPHLKNINLRDNALTIIPENLFKWDELQAFDFSDNPLLCDCRILWLQTLLNGRHNTSQTSIDNVLCAAPDNVHDQPLKTLSHDLIGCASDDMRQQAMIGILLVVSVAIITILLLLLFRCRRRLREAFKGRWNDSALGNKEREYQKTFSDEEFMHGRNLSHTPCSLNLHQPTSTLSNYSHQYHQPGIRPIPVTEL